MVNCVELDCSIVFCLALYSVWSWIGMDLIVLVWFVLSCSARYVVVWCCMVFPYIVLCLVVLYCVVLYCVVVCCVV